jgi:ADP-ribose pyrophosphatase YjhB (NUDIX family)
MSMITLDDGMHHFAVRAAGVALRDGHVLVHRSEADDFWTLPGGRVEIVEDAAAALARELLEETGMRARVGRLLWVVENFFLYGGRECHEIGFYFVVSLPRAGSGDDLAPFVGHEGDQPLRFRWQPVDRLGEIMLKPGFLGTALVSLPDEPRHLVHDERPR